MREAIKVWIRNEKKIEEAIINGEEVRVVESDFGANEFVIDFLKEAGFWDIITGMLPKMGKDNGYPSKIILPNSHYEGASLYRKTSRGR